MPDSTTEIARLRCENESLRAQLEVEQSLRTLGDGANFGIAIPGIDELQILQKALQSMKAGISIADATLPDYPVRFVNAGFEKLSGYKSDEVIGKNLRFLQGNDRDQAGTGEIKRALTNGQSTRATLRNYHKDGTPYWVEVHVWPIGGSAGRHSHFIGVQTDVTERIESDVEKQRLAARMREIARLEGLGLLAGGVAHDFNNLLVGILTAAGIALEETPEDAPARESLQLIEKTAKRAAEITKQLLAYSGRGRFLVEECSMNVLCADMERMVRRMIHQNATIISEPGENLPGVRGDKTQLRQILLNLITNASDAIRQKGMRGTIRIRTSRSFCSAEMLSSSLASDQSAPGEYVILEVIDNGVGMSPAVLDKLFTPFFTTKENGHGLGLAAMLGSIRSHQGFIVVESTEQVGTTFRLGLPVSQGDPSETGHIVRRAPAKKELGEVLVVDDDESVRWIICRILKYHGFNVLDCEDPEVAFKVFEEYRGRFQLVIADLSMPTRSGIDLIADMQAIQPDLPCILISGYDDEEQYAEMTTGRRFAFLQKPFTPTQLLNAVHELIG